MRFISYKRKGNTTKSYIMGANVSRSSRFREYLSMGLLRELNNTLERKQLFPLQFAFISMCDVSVAIWWVGVKFGDSTNGCRRRVAVDESPQWPFTSRARI